MGYKDPPRHTRFRKGKSGNPKGRPKKSRNFMTLLADELGQTVLLTEDGKKRKVSKMEAMVKRLVAGALQGDRKSMLTLIDVMKRNDQFEELEIDDFLPGNYQEILDYYVESQKSRITKRRKKHVRKTKNNKR